jgi:hypothetical protein
VRLLLLRLHVPLPLIRFYGARLAPPRRGVGSSPPPARLTLRRLGIKSAAPMIDHDEDVLPSDAAGAFERGVTTAAGLLKTLAGAGPSSPELAPFRAWLTRPAKPGKRAVLESGASIEWDSNECEHRLTIPLLGWDAASLAAALALLIESSRDLDALCAHVRPREPWDMLDLGFVAGDGALVSQREVFEACMGEEALRSLAAEWVRLLVSHCRARGDDLAAQHLWHDELHPAGCFAIVPLSLASVDFVPLAIDHLQVTDLDHETFHERWIDGLIARYGWCEPTLELIAFRAGKGRGQSGTPSLQRAAAHHGVIAYLDLHDAHDAFLARLARWRWEDEDGADPAWTAASGQALFTGDSDGYRRWLARLAALETRDASAYPQEPLDESTVPEPFDPSEDWDS